MNLKDYNPKNRDAAYIIFKFPYEVNVPEFAMRKFNRRGDVMDADKGAEARATQLTFARLTIAQMAVMLGDGITITMVNPKDTPFIYITIIKHLKRWLQRINESIHRLEVPVEDIRLLEEFARALRPLARNNAILFNQIAEAETESNPWLVDRYSFSAMTVQQSTRPFDGDEDTQYYELINAAIEDRKNACRI